MWSAQQLTDFSFLPFNERVLPLSGAHPYKFFPMNNFMYEYIYKKKISVKNIIFSIKKIILFSMTRDVSYVQPSDNDFVNFDIIFLIFKSSYLFTKK